MKVSASIWLHRSLDIEHKFNYTKILYYATSLLMPLASTYNIFPLGNSPFNWSCITHGSAIWKSNEKKNKIHPHLFRSELRSSSWSIRFRPYARVNYKALFSGPLEAHDFKTKAVLFSILLSICIFQAFRRFFLFIWRIILLLIIKTAACHIFAIWMCFPRIVCQTFVFSSTWGPQHIFYILLIDLKEKAKGLRARHSFKKIIPIVIFFFFTNS